MKTYLIRYKRLRPILLILLFSVSHQSIAMSPAEAADAARDQTGGKVLKVKSQGDDQYNVKVLLPNGQVRNISIGSDDNSDNNRNDDRSNERSNERNDKKKGKR